MGTEAQNLCNKKQKKIKQRKYININVMNRLPKLVKLDEYILLIITPVIIIIIIKPFLLMIKRKEKSEMPYHDAFIGKREIFVSPTICENHIQKKKKKNLFIRVLCLEIETLLD